MKNFEHRELKEANKIALQQNAIDDDINYLQMKEDDFVKRNENINLSKRKLFIASVCFVAFIACSIFFISSDYMANYQLTKGNTFLGFTLNILFIMYAVMVPNMFFNRRIPADELLKSSAGKRNLLGFMSEIILSSAMIYLVYIITKSIIASVIYMFILLLGKQYFSLLLFIIYRIRLYIFKIKKNGLLKKRIL